MKLKKLEKQPCNYLTTWGATYLLDDGTEYTTEFVSRKRDLTKENLSKKNTDAVICFVTNKDNSKVLLIKEFRMAINQEIISFPAGLIDDGETPSESAIRELQEETGVVALEVTKVTKPAYSSPGLTDELLQIVYITGSENILVEKDNNPKEKIEMFWASRDEVKKILNSDIGIEIRAQILLDGWLETKTLPEKILDESRKTFFDKNINK